MWQRLYDDATEILNRFGVKDYHDGADYWIVDDDWGWDVLQLEFQNLKMLRSHAVKLLQDLLVADPEWMMTIHVQSPEVNAGMGLFVYPDRIVDDLNREFLPAEFQDMKFEATGGRP